MNNFVHFSAKLFFLKVFAGHEKRKHDNYAEMNSLNSDPFSAQSSEDGQKRILSTTSIFPRNVCWSSEKQFWQVCRNKFAKLRDIFCSKPTNVEKFVFILPIDFSWKYLLETKNAFSTEPPKHFCWSLVFFGSKCGKRWNKIVTFSVKLFFSSECFVDTK